MLSEEEQEGMLSNVKVRLENHKRLASLEILCARKIGDLLPSYAKRGHWLRLTSVLPKALCSLVYQELLPHKTGNGAAWAKEWSDGALKDRANLFAGLDHFDCIFLNMQNDVLTKDDHPHPFEQFAQESPSLSDFKVGALWWCLELKNRVQLATDFFSLKFMPSLVVLELQHYPVKDADLQFIGDRLPLLQRLTLFAPLTVEAGHKLVITISFKGLGHLKSLTFLKHLTFWVQDQLLYCPQNIKLVKSCLQLMPKVNTMGIATCVCPYFVPHEFPSYKDPVELGLEHLVWGQKTVIPANVTLPNVTRITVHGTPTINLLQFEKLSHLVFKNREDSSELVQNHLSQVGNPLKTLHLPVFDKYDLKQVLQFCPNLDVLFIGRLLDGNFDSSSQLRNFVQNLKSFRQHAGPMDRINCPGLLTLLLTSCPKLETLELASIRLTKAEIDLINEKMKAGTLFIKKLQKVTISALCDQDALVPYADFVAKLCVENCTILKQVYITSNSNRDVPEFKLAENLQNYIRDSLRYAYLKK